MIILYFFIAFIVGSFSLYHLLKKGKKKSYGIETMDVVGYAFASIFLGLAWIVTIWVALIKWAADEETPYWVEPIKVIYQFGRDKCKK